MRHYTATEHVPVPMRLAWYVLADVRAWPAWTPTMTSVELLDGASLAVGARVRIRQPRLREATWTVTTCTPGCEFTWESRHPGVRVRAMHRLDPTADGCTLRQELRFDGLLAGLVAHKLGPLARHYMQEEADGFRRRCMHLYACGASSDDTRRRYA